MPMQRRKFMKASGVAAVLGITGLAGCNGILGGGGGSGADSWQYDPETAAQDRSETQSEGGDGDQSGGGNGDQGGSLTQARVFGSMDFGSLYEIRDQLPESVRSSFEVDSSSSVSPEDVDILSGVGGGQMSVDTGAGGFFGSLAVTGSFDPDALGEELQSEGEVEQSGSYEGYTLYEGANMGQMPTGGMGATTDATATVAVSDSAVVFGVTVSQESDLGLTGQDAVEASIDANAGNADLLSANSDHVSTLKNELGGSTMIVGGDVDQSLVEAYREQAGGGGGMGADAMLNGLRAGGFDADVGGETTTYNLAVVYNNGDNAEGSGILNVVDTLKESLTNQEGINSVTSNRNGATILVTIEGDTETLLSQDQSQVPMGATAGVDAVPTDF